MNNKLILVPLFQDNLWLRR